MSEVRTMGSDLTLMEREALLADLQQAFDLQTAEVLLGVLGKVAAQIHAAGVTREDFRELKQIVADLTEAQRHTTEEIRKLAEAQARTERVLQQLSRQVGGLSDTVGGDIEDIAYIVLHDVLKREFGWQVGVLERSWQTWGRKPEEVNVFGQASDPARPDRVIWIVGEAKRNLSAREVKRFIKQVARAREQSGG
ncbi:MAG TPA: hypothetical protein EYP49_19720 [Anaerolineae bacterium]|nr:hypothetical protein [Anaerolineae bacterium]